MEQHLIFDRQTPSAALLEKVSGMAKNALETGKKPLLWLAGYYSSVLGRAVSLRLTLHLLNAQAAFALAAFPAESPLVLRAAFMGWFLHAVCKCRRELQAAS